MAKLDAETSAPERIAADGGRKVVGVELAERESPITASVAHWTSSKAVGNDAAAP